MSSLMNVVRSALILGVLSFGAIACGAEYERTEITGVRVSNLGGEVSVQRIDVPEGLIVKAHIVVWNDDNEAMTLSVRAVDPNIVEVAGVVNDRDYAFIGKKQGRTAVQFLADGKVVLTVQADVTAQPTLP